MMKFVVVGLLINDLIDWDGFQNPPKLFTTQTNMQKPSVNQEVRFGPADQLSRTFGVLLF